MTTPMIPAPLPGSGVTTVYRPLDQAALPALIVDPMRDDWRATAEHLGGTTLHFHEVHALTLDPLLIAGGGAR